MVKGLRVEGKAFFPIDVHGWRPAEAWPPSRRDVIAIRRRMGDTTTTTFLPSVHS